MPQNLDPRLSLLYRMTPPCDRAADIGTDHGYLICALVESGRARRGIAADIHEKPLEKARQEAARRGLSGRMDFVLGDGLDGISPEGLEVVIIAGMGGETIAAILSAAPWVREKNMPLILQPMSSFPDLREWLDRNGFSIEEERLAREGDVLYTALLVRAGEMFPLSPAELRAGKNTADPLRGDWLNMWIARTRRALEGMAQAQGEGVLPRKRELEEVLGGLIGMKKEWEQWQQ